ncbi:MAG: glycoside hydrolase family 16 protein [Ferruginibacter sp.]
MKIRRSVALVIFFGLSLLFLQQTSLSQTMYKKLVWADEFNYKGSPDSTKWSFDMGNGCPSVCGWGNNELEFYTNRIQNARVEKGKLIIEARKEVNDKFNYTSARVVSKNKGDWKYGRIEVKAKIPAGTGMWPAIWMLPTNWEYGGWPRSGEIDIMENVGYWPDSVLSTVHTGAYNGMLNTQKTAGVNRNDLSAKFHVYAAEWTADSIRFFIDNIPYHTFKNDHTGTEAWPFDKEFHLLMNIAVGGNWGGKYGVDDKIFPQKMEIDFVRVYQ